MIGYMVAWPINVEYYIFQNLYISPVNLRPEWAEPTTNCNKI